MGFDPWYNDTCKAGRYHSLKGGDLVNDMPSLAEIAERNIRENEQRKLLALLKDDGQSKEDIIKVLETLLENKK